MLRKRSVFVLLTTLLLSSIVQNPSHAAGTNGPWTSRTSAADNDWRSVTYGNGLYVAVASSGIGNRVMTSPDGITWTARSSAADLFWISVTYGNGIFVAVARSISATGTNNRVMTSPDGISWTTRTSAADNDWVSITYGNGLFVAVAAGGGDSDATKATKRVMTSADGVTWTLRTPANSTSAWFSVTYGAGKYVVVASTGTDRVMTSPDGITWTAQTAAASLQWLHIIYANNLFVALSNDTTPGNSFMTSPDGVTWTRRNTSFDTKMTGIAYGAGKFYAVSSFVSGKQTLVLSSEDAINWESETAAADNNWRSVIFGDNQLVAVAFSGSGNRVMSYSISNSQPPVNSESQPTAAELEAKRQRAIAMQREVVLGLVSSRKPLTKESLIGADFPLVNPANLVLVNQEIAKLGDDEVRNLVKTSFFLDKYATVERLASESHQNVTVSKLIEMEIVDKNLYQKQLALSSLKKLPETDRDSIEEIQIFFKKVSDRVVAIKRRIAELQKR